MQKNKYGIDEPCNSNKIDLSELDIIIVPLLAFNKNLYPGFDPKDQNVGLKTPLDKMYHADPGGVSPNPMDKNWGGAEYTEKRVEAGDYKDDEVKIYIPN